MLVQIYGITTVSDATAVDDLGADHIGVVLDEGIETWDSVDEETALAIGSSLTRARLVALSLSTDPVRIGATCELLQPALLHLARAHEMETAVLAELRSSLGRPLMLTVPVASRDALPTAERLGSVSDYLLLDTAHPDTGRVGATGLTHDWEMSAAIVDLVDRPVLLAGGLGPDNVCEAIRRVSPAGVDSETRTSHDPERRRKDLEKVCAFVRMATASGVLAHPTAEGKTGEGHADKPDADQCGDPLQEYPGLPAADDQ